MKFKDNEYILNDSSCNQVSIDNMEKLLTGGIIDTASKIFKKKKIRKKMNPTKKWLSKSLTDMKIELNRMAKTLRNENNERMNHHRRGLYFSLKKKFKKAIKSAKLKYKQDLMDKIASMENSNPKMFWQLIKDLKSNNVKDNPIVLNIWEDYFKRLGLVKIDNNRKFDERIQGVTERLLSKRLKVDDLDKDISDEEINLHIKKIKLGKSEGEDRISNEFIKYGGDILTPFMLKLFNTILQAEMVPTSWGVGLICPIYKSGDRQDPNNYRGITLSNNISKLFNRILNARLVTFLDKNHLMCPEQIGFRQGARTADHIFVFKTIIDHYKYRKLPVFTCFIDLRKAFDSIWRVGMYFKLLQAGVSSKFVSIVKDLYNKTKNRVLMNGFLSNTFETNVGTRQGCNISPTLFNIYLNDLCKMVKENNCDPVKLGGKDVNMLMYADDIILLSKSKEGLQKSLNVCQRYFVNWKLQLNIRKTKVMVFNNGTKSTPSFHYGNDPIEAVMKYKYLGIYLSNKGSFKLALDDLLVKAKKAYAAMYQSLNIYNGAKPKIILKAVDTMVFPILMYGCEVWAPYIYKHSLESLFRNLRDKVEKFHTRICKNILGVKRRTSDIACRSELGRYPLSINIICNTFAYYVRLQHAEQGSLLDQAALVQKSLHLSHQKNIYSFIECICHELTHPRQQAVPGIPINKYRIKTLTKKLREHLLKNYNMIQKEAINRNGKLEILSIIKHNVKFENYLRHLNLSQRLIISKLRLSDHNLPIEHGRKNNIPRHKRYCTKCKSGAVGDEFHTLMICCQPEIQSIRSLALYEISKLIPQFTMLSLKEKFIYIMSCCDINCTKIVAPFIRKGMAYAEN